MPPPERLGHRIGSRRSLLRLFVFGELGLELRLPAILLVHPLAPEVLLLLIPMMLPSMTLVEVVWLLALYLLLIVDHLQLVLSMDQHLVV